MVTNPIVDQWRGLNQQERGEAMSRMNSQQKMKLATALGYQGQKSAPQVKPESWGQKAVNALPLVGGIAGAFAGEGVGSIPGAAAGATLGKEAKEYISEKEGWSKKPTAAKEAEGLAKTAGTYAGLEATGLGAMKALGKVGEVIAPKAESLSDRLIAKIIKPSLSAKSEVAGSKGALDSVQQISHAVGKVAKNAKTLSGLQENVTGAINSITDASGKMLQKYDGIAQPIRMQKILGMRGQEAIRDLDPKFVTDKTGTVRQLLKNIDKHMMDEFGTRELSPSQALQLRRWIRGGTKDADGITGMQWPAGTKTLRDSIYRDLNKSIESRLSGADAQEFRAGRSAVHRLLKGSEAIDRQQAMKFKRGLKMMSIYGTGGGIVGYELGGKKGAVAGALAGASLGSVPAELTAAQGLRGIAKAGKKLAAEDSSKILERIGGGVKESSKSVFGLENQ